MNQFAQEWWAQESPGFSYRCECGLIITGNSEKGLHSLVKKHRERGIFHCEYLGVPYVPQNRKRQEMPVPEGVITTSDINKPEEKKDDLPTVSDSSESEQPERTEESK